MDASTGLRQFRLTATWLLYGLLAACLALLACSTAEASAGKPAVRQYCIIGAGPAGVQLGHFLKHSGRDFVILERNFSAGVFFSKFPRHRMLISLNKRVVREGRSADFAFRHDWNSLLDLRSTANRTRPVTERSKLLFPRADVLWHYIMEFAEELRDNVQYGVAVVLVQRVPGEDTFELTLERSQEGDPGNVSVEVLLCREVIAATGFWKPRGVRTRVDGAAYVEGYESLPETGERFEGKSVVVMGLGNAALETVQELQKYTAEVHLFARERPLPEGGKGVRFAYQTHYVGDIRAGRTTILDTYLLKSLDSFDFNALEGPRRLVIVPCSARLCLWTVEAADCADDPCRAEFHTGGQQLNYWLSLTKWLKGGRLGASAREVLERHVPGGEAAGFWRVRPLRLHADDDELDEEERRLPPAERQQLRAAQGIDDGVFGDDYEELQVLAALLRERPRLMDELVPFRAAASDNLRYPVDHVIRCFGWALDRSIFHESLGLDTTHRGKYPKITPMYRAEGVPGLYFAGTLAHGLDFRKSAGGFIHGFRYTARALFRSLEEKNFGVAWPHQRFALDPGGGGSGELDELTRLLQDRINNASGPYQMFQSLGDFVVFELSNETGRWTALFLEEVPLRHYHARFRDVPRLDWFFRYGDKLYGPKVLGSERVGSTNPYTAEKSSFLHPQLNYYPAGADEPTLRHWITEDIFTQWNSADVYAPLARFLARATAAATGDNRFTEEGAVQLERNSSKAWNQCIGVKPHDACTLIPPATL